jgi:hypothetical protein
LIPAEKNKRDKTIPEKEVVGLWQKRMRRQRTVADTAGKTLEVVYPGRLNDNRGGDFRDAVISNGNELNFGCIEIHSRTSGWKVHGHQADPHYNQVVLHVALDEDAAADTVRQDGAVIPTVILSQNRLPPQGGNTGAGHPSACRAAGRKKKPGETVRWLERAGLQRFRLKAQRFFQGWQENEEGQCLYLGIMEALGFNKNGSQFLKLGRLLPLVEAESIADRNRKNPPVVLQAAYLGTAGLLPSQGRFSSVESRFLRELEPIWAGMPGKPEMSGLDWELFKVRPVNHPVRRIIALSCLIMRFRAAGWKQSLEGMVVQAQSTADFSTLENALMVGYGEQWGGNCGEDLSPGKGAGVCLLGRERSREIIINVLLPYLRAGAESGRLPASAERADIIFSRYPRTESNSIERHMRSQLGLEAGQVNTACLQQGLIHIYRQYCIRGKCSECGT